MNGFHDLIDEATYHADRTSLSVTGAKLLLRSPALFRHEQDNPTPPTDAMLFGTAFHTRILGTGQRTIVIPPTSRAKADQEAHKAAKAEAAEAGLIGLTPDQDATLDAMAAAVRNHVGASRLLELAPDREISAYATDPATGVLRRCRYDAIGPRIAVDVKTSVTADPRELAGRWGIVAKRGYDQQASWYLDVAAANGRPLAAFGFIFVEKVEPYQVTVAYVADDDLYTARARNQTALERFRDCTESGVWPSYLPDDTAAAISLTDQTYTEEKIV